MPDAQKPEYSLLRYTHVGLQFAVTVCVCCWGGLWLDKRWGTAPWLVLAGTALGFSAGLYMLIRGLGQGES